LAAGVNEMPFIPPAVTLKFQPEVGEPYYTINGWQVVLCRTWNDHKIDFQRARHGNVFETFAEAARVRAGQQKALVAAQSA
jgi:hypothetical protein